MSRPHAHSRHNHSFRLAIIGTGFTGGMLCLHLARQGYDLTQACVIGTGTPDQLGHGAAYGCQHPDFRLNVRDDLMVIDADTPDEFVAWARQNINDREAVVTTTGEKFYRRQDFATFITAALAKAGVPNTLTHIKGTATGLTRHKETVWQIGITTATSKITLTAERVIIATGNPPPATDTLIPPDLPERTKQQIITRAWDGTWLGKIKRDDHVLLVGGGLTALDACLALDKQSHKGRITLVTPRLPLPPRQVAWHEAADPPPPWRQPLTAAKFLHHFRACLPQATTQADTETPAWQEAFENLRSILQTGWVQLPASQKIKLHRRLGWLWHRLRYRAAPQTLDAVQALTANKQLQLVIGRVAQIQSPSPQHTPSPAPPVTAVLAPSANNKTADDTNDKAKSIACDWLVIASGPGHDPLTHTLIQNGLVAPDPHHRWILVNSNNQVLAPNKNNTDNHTDTDTDTDDDIVPNLWLLGPPSQFSLGDVVGASTIARHAKQLATLINSQP